MSEAENVALYFGCLGGVGHYLHRQPGVQVGRLSRDFLSLPWSFGLMDTGLLKNRKAPDEPDGRVHWTCGGATEFWFAFVWWDRSVDKRSQSNSGFYVRFGSPAEARSNLHTAFEFACQAWPAVVSRQQFPLVLVTAADTA